VPTRVRGADLDWTPFAAHPRFRANGNDAVRLSGHTFRKGANITKVERGSWTEAAQDVAVQDVAIGSERQARESSCDLKVKSQLKHASANRPTTTALSTSIHAFAPHPLWQNSKS